MRCRPGIVTNSQPETVPAQRFAPNRRLMDRQSRELALLCIIAATSGMLAWALDRPLTAAAFAAAATFIVLCRWSGQPPEMG